MKYLNSIIDKQEVKNFIENNSDRVIDFTKRNFDVKELYSSIVENLDDYTNDDINIMYNNIKNTALNYTCAFLLNNSKKKTI